MCKISIKLKITLILLFSITLISCKEIIDEELSNKTIKIVSPINNAILTTNDIYFLWDEVEGATKYNIQIVTPSFNNINQFVLDSLIQRNKYNITLKPGLYEWRIKALNSSSETNYQNYKFTIDSTSNLSNFKVNILFPNNNDSSNKTILNLSWEKITVANSYNIEVWSPNFNGSKIFSTMVENNNYNLNLNEGDFEIGIRALNQNSSTLFSKRKVFIDLTSPSTPVLVAPKDTIKNSSFYFRWNHADNSNSFIDSLYILNSNNTILKKIRLINKNEFKDSLGLGIFYWKVKSFDPAGNQSEYSILKKLLITN